MRRFVTFEGIEGSGKSTQIKLAAEYLSEKKIPFVLTAEPSGTDLGASLARILFDRNHTALCAEAELLLFCAARAQHVRQKIMPALKEGKTVLCDRFSDATYAYQGFGRGLDKELIRKINDFSACGLRPDLTLLFDLPAEVGLQRALKRNHALLDSAFYDRFERENMAFHERVREGYLHLCKSEPDRFRLIDAMPAERIVQEEVRRHLEDFIHSP